MTKDQDIEDFSKMRLPCPKAVRRFETIGGGFMVVERPPVKKRLRPAPWPLEVASMQEAVSAVNALQEKHPDRGYCIFHQIAASERKADQL